MSLFVVRKPKDFSARIAQLRTEQDALGHEKLALQLRLSTIIDRQSEIKYELAALGERMKEIA